MQGYVITPRCKWCRCGLKIGEVATCDQCKDDAERIGQTIDQLIRPQLDDGGMIIPTRIMNAMRKEPLFASLFK